MDTTAREAGGDRRGTRGGNRRHRFPARTKQVFVRLSKDEYDDLAAAAARVELTPTGYVAETALAAARGIAQVGAQLAGAGITGSELAQLQRDLFAARTALTRLASSLDQTITAMADTGGAAGALGEAASESRHVLRGLDTVVAAIDGRLR